MTLQTYKLAPRGGRPPKSLVILLHGLGSNGQDLISLAPYWQDALADTLFLSPDAPFPCDMAPMGHQWFSLRDWTPSSILRGVKEAEPLLQSYISAMQAEYGIPDEKTALVGFSQGTMMSLYAGPRREGKIAGILGYSGALIGAETLGDLTIHKVPVHIVHGDVDTVVPVAAWHMAKDALESNGFTVTGNVSRGLLHSIDEDGIRDGGEFLRKILS